MQRQRDHGDQRTRDDERTCPLHKGGGSGAARPQCGVADDGEVGIKESGAERTTVCFQKQRQSYASMPTTRETLQDESIEQLADRMQDGPNSGRLYYAPLAELERRRVGWEEEVSRAQKEAAEAAKATAEYTRKNVRAMWWSVAVLAAGSIITAFFQFLSWRAGR
jgi:hypothetical protein